MNSVPARWTAGQATLESVQTLKFNPGPGGDVQVFTVAPAGPWGPAGPWAPVAPAAPVAPVAPCEFQEIWVNVPVQVGAVVPTFESFPDVERHAK